MLFDAIFSLGRTTILSYATTLIAFCSAWDMPESQAQKCQEIAKTILAFLPGRNVTCGIVLIGVCSLGAAAIYEKGKYYKIVFPPLDITLMCILPVFAGIYQLSLNTTYAVFKHRLIRQELGV